MNWRNVRLIASREVQDQLRDRRTLFMVLVLPLVLYPALAIGMLQMQTFFVEQTRTVVVLGAKHLPQEDSYELIDSHNGRFHAGWFSSPVNVDKLRVVSDLPAEADTSKTKAEEDVRLIVAAREIRKKVERRTEIQRELGIVTANGSIPPEAAERPESAELIEELALLNKELGRLFAESEIQVLIVIPDGFAEHLEAVNASLENREGGEPDADAIASAPQPLIVRNSADEKSRIAYGRVKEALDEWKAHIIRDRLDRANLPSSITDVETENVEIAGNEEFTANIWGKLFPALLVVMCVTGAFHPAVDLAAGEKERGTMETLLICPASRTEIVIGKFLTIMLFSVTTAMLNLISMGITAAYIISMRAEGGAAGASQFASLGFPGMGAIGWVILLSVPLAALFSALCLSLSTFARSVKEGQYYLTPLLMVTLGLTVFCMSPGAEIDPLNSIMPVVGPALLLKELLATSGSSGYLYVVPVLATSIGYSALALWWAIDQFQREDVLFREAERFDVRLWFRHLLREKDPTPTFGEAVFCLLLMVFLQFASIGVFQNYAGTPDSPGYGVRSVQLLMIQQLVFFATPALMMAVVLTADPLRTLRVRLPPLKHLGAAVLLAICLRPVAIETLGWLDSWFFHDLPTSVSEQLRQATSTEVSLGLALLAFAVVPGICEEIAFRGFILSGFDNRNRTGIAIALSSIAFGVIHMVPQMVMHAALLGVVIGLLAVRSRSLFVCIAFHITSNAATVVHSRAVNGGLDIPGYDWIVHRTAESARFHPAVLAVCGAISLALIVWLIANKPPIVPNRRATDASLEPDDSPLPREPASIG